MNRSESIEKLNEIKMILQTNREEFKAYFGLLFWELNEASKQFSHEEISQQKASLTLDHGDDESYGVLLGIYLQLWDSAKDFNAASRFLASSLGISGDELIQCKIIYDKKGS